MKKFVLAALLALALPLCALAQPRPADCTVYGFCYGVGTPAGNCKPGQLYSQTDVPANVYSCSGITPAWHLIGGGATGASSPFSSYFAFGDSITYGYELSSQTAAYEYYLGTSIGVIPVNLGVPAAQSFGTDSVIFNNSASINFAPTTVISETIGVNNVNAGGASANLQTMYGNNIFAQYAWLALTPARKIQFNTSSGITYAGTWTHSTLFGASDPGKTCTGTSCSATFTGTGSVLYLVTGASTSNAAAATLTCDGTATGATPLFAGVGGTAFTGSGSGTQLLRVSLASGSHSCTVQSTSSTGNVNLEWAAFLTGASVTDGPYLLGVQIIDQYPINANQVSYTAQQSTVTSQMVSDGLVQVGYPLTTGLLNANSYADGALHPNEYAHWQVSAPIISTLSSLSGYSLLQPGYIGAAIYNQAKSQKFNMVASGAYNDSAITTGTLDTAFGSGAGQAITTGYGITGLGYYACAADTTGYQNTCIGSQAGQYLSAGYNNLFLGPSSGGLATTASSDIGIGTQALGNTTTSNGNQAIGVLSLGADTTGSNNTAIGNYSCQSVTTGGLNLCLGLNTGDNANAGTPLTTDLYVSLLGVASGKNTASIISDATAVGANAMVSASHQVTIGAPTVTQTTLMGTVSAPAYSSPSITAAPLSTPSAIPTITTSGTAGTTTDTYLLVGRSSCTGGYFSAASSTTSIATANATLSSTNYNVLTLPPYNSGIAGYDIYRTVAGGTPSTTGKIITCATGVTVSDTGLAGDSTTAPTVATGGVMTVSLIAPGTLFSAGGTALPTCAAGYKGFRAVVSDATSPSYMGAYTSGGAITTEVICSYNGTTYAWLTH